MDMESILKQIKQGSREKALNNGAYTGYRLISELKDISNMNKPVLINMKLPIYDEEYEIIDYTYEIVSSDFKCGSWRGSYDLPSAGYVSPACNVSMLSAAVRGQCCRKSLLYPNQSPNCISYN